MGNLKKIHLDNSRPFPFGDSSFDTIILRKGLCLCRGAMCCGVAPTPNETLAFMREVVRVLDLRNPASKAILHGENGVDAYTLGRWTSVFRQIEREYNVDVTEQYTRDARFHSLLIVPRK